MRSTVPSTRRLPLAAGAVLTVVAVAALGACTGSGSSDSTDGDGHSSPVAGSSVSPAPPGKYRTLPQPCTSVDMDSLKNLVPGAKDYAGAEALTYDTDRLVGCSWRGTTTDGVSRSLNLSVVRVVSYDPAVSDEAQATADFEKKAKAASIPSGSPSGSTSPGDATSSGTGGPSGNGTSTSTGTGNAGSSGSSTTASNGGTGSNGSDGTNSASTDLAPRRLSGVGNAAFIDDVSKTPGTTKSSTVTLVFRTANVLATVTYAQSSPAHAQPPKNADLQKDAEKVASDLQHKVEG